MNNIIPLNFESNDVRVTSIDGDPWFVASDVCEILALANTSMAIKGLDDDEVTLSKVEGSHRPTNLVSESGLYALIVRSKKSEAKKFRRWITGEVLPSIRKTGAYGDDSKMKIPQTLPEALRFAADLADEVKVMKVEQQKSDKVINRIIKADGSLCLRDAAKDLQVRPIDLRRWLVQSKWIYRKNGSSEWIAYQDKIQSGLMEHKVTTVDRSDGSEKITTQVRVTGKGIAKLADIMIDQSA